MTELVLSSTNDDGVCQLVMNRPEAYNALSRPLMSALIAALETAGDNEACKVFGR